MSAVHEKTEPEERGAPQATRASARRNRIAVIAAADVVALLVASIAGLALWAVIRREGTDSRTYSFIWWAFTLTTVGAFILYGLYTRLSRRIIVAAHDDLRDIFQAVALAAVLTGGIARYVVHVPLRTSQLVVVGLLAFVSVPLARAAVATLLVLLIPLRILIVGTGAVAAQVAQRLSHETEQGVEIVGFVDDDPVEGSTVLGGLDDLPRLCTEHSINRVLVVFSRTPPHETAETLRRLAPSVAISVVPRLYELVCWRSQLDELQGIPMMDVAPPQLSLPARIGKRTFDIVVSTIALVSLSPLLLAIALAVRLSSRGPALFVQPRSGRYGKVFDVIKFRTMRRGAEEERWKDLASRSEVDGPLFKIADDPRRTRLGRFLRKTSLDELPQLINVLKGDMSIVGPRPFVVSEAEQIDGWAARRLDARPGITGLWQVSGRNDLSYAELRALDYAYVSSWSFWWDIRILAQTPIAVLKRRGAS